MMQKPKFTGRMKVKFKQVAKPEPKAMISEELVFGTHECCQLMRASDAQNIIFYIKNKSYFSNMFFSFDHIVSIIRIK